VIHPKTELRHVSDTVGYGVFATEFIPQGTIVYVKDSLEIEVSEEDYHKHSKAVQDIIEKYSYIDERGYRIISWDFAKYVNHSCDSNTISTGYGFEIAIRDIQPGEQITDEYGIFNLDFSMGCSCGSSNCRKKISPTDFETYNSLWDEKITHALSKLKSVSQPLYGMIENGCRTELENYLNKKGEYRPIYSLRYKRTVNA